MKQNKIVDILIAFASIFAIIMLVIVSYYSITYWAQFYSGLTLLNEKMFYIGMLMGIMSGIMTFIQQFIKAFGESYGNIFTDRKKGGKTN